MVRDSQDHKPDKTGVFDKLGAFEQCGARGISDSFFGKGFLVLNAKDEKVYPFDAAEFRKNFQEAGQLLGFKNLHPYQSRHGGASEDLNSGERDHLAVKVRGRWAHGPKCAKIWKGGENSEDDDRFITQNEWRFVSGPLRNIERVLKGDVAFLRLP